MEKDATIYDVAHQASVSITTVSRFLNSPTKVAENTRRKIEDAMRKLDFTPKAEAVARARRGVKRIGVITPFFTAPSFVLRLNGIQEALVASGYDLITYAINSVDQLQGYLRMLPYSGRIDGLIIMSLPFLEEDFIRFEKSGIPLVCLEFGHESVSSIVIDNRNGGRMAADFFIDKGYKNFAFMGEGGQPAYSLHATEERLLGYRERLAEFGYVLEDINVRFHPYGIEFAVECAKGLLKGNNYPKAVFCSSDLQAVGLIKAAQQMNIRIPEDVAVLGFDDIDLAGYMGISTIRQLLKQSGTMAVEQLMAQMENPKIPKEKIELELSIIERQTTP